jgi:hypothetical protein
MLVFFALSWHYFCFFKVLIALTANHISLSRVQFMIVSIQRATELTGLSRSTINRHIASGKLTKTGKGIDTNDLIKCYEDLKPNTTGTGEDANSQTAISEHEQWLMDQVEYLLHEIKELKREAIHREERLLGIIESKLVQQPDPSPGLFRKFWK